MSSSKRARRRRRQAARKTRAKRTRLAPPPAVVALRPGQGYAPIVVSKPITCSALAGVGAASMIMLPAVHKFTHPGPPFYATMTAGAISPDRPDSPHTDGLEWLHYQVDPQIGTARADVMVGPVDPWADEIALYRYGQAGPNLSGD